MNQDAKSRANRFDRHVLRREFALNNTSRRWIAAGLAIFLVFSICVYNWLYSGIRKTVIQQSERNMANISALNADAVSRGLANRLTLLETFCANLPIDMALDIEKVLQRMAIYVVTYHFQNIGILTADSTLYLTNGLVLDVSEIPQYQDAYCAESRISSSFVPADGSESRVNLLSAPLMHDGEIQYVITATQLSRDLADRMNISALEGKGHTFLVNPKGEVVISPACYDDPDYLNLMRFINESSDILPGASRSSSFRYEGETYYAIFESLSINDWCLMTCALERDVYADASSILTGVAIGMSLLWLMLVSALGFILYLCVRFKYRAQQAVFYDKLLGIRNGEFLRVYYPQLTKEQLSHLAFAVLDIDKFKEFNYLYGDDAGDNLLHYIADVFQQEMPGDFLFRFLSDHFVMLMDFKTRDDVIAKLNRMLQHMTLDIDNGVIQPFDLSIGIRRVREGESLHRIFSDALLAKSTVKGIQIQQYAFYDENLRFKRMNYMEMESDFNKALREGEFHVYYQPKYDMRTGRIVGAEALVRWVKPDGSIIPPNAFIPCFEASRQVIRLDEAMLESVCSQMNDMEAEGIAVLPVSVNLSRVHLKHRGTLGKIQETLKSSGVNPANLSFEITERAVYEESIPLKEIISSLHRMGCRVDMDDYGMGLSGPNTLANNEFDVIKLDRAFIAGIGNSKMEAVIRSTVRLSAELGMNIVAEGVEEKYQAETLVSWGCHCAQGYYYSPPVPEAEYRKMLRNNVGSAKERTT